MIQLTIMQNQCVPWACFPATQWSHLGVTGNSVNWSVLLMSSLLHNLILAAVTAKSPASKKQGVENGSILFIAFVTVSGYSMLILIQNLWRFEVVSNILLRPSSFPISRSWSFSSMDKADSPGLCTNGSRTHSSHVQGILWLVSNAQILLKTGISDHAPAGKSVGFWLKACHQMQLVTCHTLIEFWYESASNWFTMVSVLSWWIRW